MSELITEKKLKWLLEEKYGCRCDGKCMPPPYCSEDEMPSIYVSPSGLYFTVSPPPNGIGYKPYMVDNIIKVGKLDVVIKIGDESLDPHELIKNAPDDYV